MREPPLGGNAASQRPKTRCVLESCHSARLKDYRVRRALTCCILASIKGDYTFKYKPCVRAHALYVVCPVFITLTSAARLLCLVCA
jgi:hypothetical protein